MAASPADPPFDPTPRPDNRSGHGSGMYASPADAASYLKAIGGWLAAKNAAWVDHWSGPGGEPPDWLRGEFLTVWQADNHLVKWAVATGRLDPATLPEQKARLVGRHTAIVYHRSLADRKALGRESERYAAEQWAKASDLLLAKHPELAAREGWEPF